MGPEDRRIDFDVGMVIATAIQGDERSWAKLIYRFQPIINSVCRGYRLTADDAADVSQTVWLRARQSLGRLREPRAFPGWIKTTATHAASDVVRVRKRVIPYANSTMELNATALDLATDDSSVDGRMLRAERQAAVRAGLAALSERDRTLLTLLVADPPIPYLQISEQLGLPVGSIGPTRARCLRKLAATPTVRALAPEPQGVVVTVQAVPGDGTSRQRTEAA